MFISSQTILSQWSTMSALWLMEDQNFFFNHAKTLKEAIEMATVKDIEFLTDVAFQNNDFNSLLASCPYLPKDVFEELLRRSVATKDFDSLKPLILNSLTTTEHIDNIFRTLYEEYETSIEAYDGSYDLFCMIENCKTLFTLITVSPKTSKEILITLMEREDNYQTTDLGSLARHELIARDHDVSGIITVFDYDEEINENT